MPAHTPGGAHPRIERIGSASPACVSATTSFHTRYGTSSPGTHSLGCLATVTRWCGLSRSMLAQPMGTRRGMTRRLHDATNAHVSAVAHIQLKNRSHLCPSDIVCCRGTPV